MFVFGNYRGAHGGRCHGAHEVIEVGQERRNALFNVAPIGEILHLCVGLFFHKDVVVEPEFPS